MAPNLWPQWWRLTVISAGALILCSCQGIGQQQTPDLVEGYSSPPVANPVANTLPPTAWTGPPRPLVRQWSPPGISGPWPADEYLCDGGDKGVSVHVQKDWTVEGLQLEDTVAHFDTIDGRRVVEPSNQVCIYAPRFGSVRRVETAGGYDARQALVRYDEATGVKLEEESLGANTALQQVRLEGSAAIKGARNQQRNLPGLEVENSFALLEANNGFKVHENLRVLRDGVYLQSEQPQLAMRTEAAAIWTIDKGVQVVLDKVAALVTNGDARVQATYATDYEGESKLRIVKVASDCVGHPGEEIEFTLRFDNIGSEMLGNVTIIDNLTTRLEYVPGSQTSTIKADFLPQVNQGDSLALRWEIIDPLPAGQGGIIRFKCRIR